MRKFGVLLVLLFCAATAIAQNGTAKSAVTTDSLKRFVKKVLAEAKLTNEDEEVPSPFPIIPYPASLTPLTGTFTIMDITKLSAPANNVFANEAGILNELFAHCIGKPLTKGAGDGNNTVLLKLDNTIKAAEGYKLEITANHLTLAARTPAGMFMGVQTIRQLLPPDAEYGLNRPFGRITLPAVTIADEPAYAWRGMHLDVSRHFFSIDYLKKFINVMSLYKFNKLHLHLTDDQGWRIEIKKYPLLTQVGAWRTFNNQDSACMQKAADNPDFAIDTQHIIHKNGKTLYGGFYTQAQLKALVAYAQKKHVDIIPEIDMPGHMMAAINQYPYLSCNGGSTFGELFSTPICPCLPSTFAFAQDIYSEVMDIFPSTYIHVGGDEVDRSAWAKSDECKALMQAKGLKNTAELQSYFIDSMEHFFNKHGRKMIGWDEVLEGGVSKTAIIMYWRSWVPKAPVEAARLGNKVIMTPGNPLYFDGIPDKNSIANVYNFYVVPAGLTEAEGKNIIGAQANTWTEMIPSEKRADYMYMPRMTALAEVLWTNKKDYASYTQRLTSHFARLDELHVNYRLPDIEGLVTESVFVDSDTLAVKKPLSRLTMRYTTDGSLPTGESDELTKPLIITKPTQFKLAAFRNNGLRGEIYTINYRQQSLAEAENVTGLSDGLQVSRYKGRIKKTTLMPAGQPDTAMTVSSVNVPKVLEADAFGLKYRGYIDVPQDGVYSFYFTCDDGGVLKIAGRDVVDNDGNHSPQEKDGQVALKKGLHTFVLDFIEGGGGYTLKLQYSLNGGAPADVPGKWLKH